MKLYLHIGTEKTGSSYLQTLLANNRDQLLRHGYFFPEAGKREKDMLNGNISPGNGRPLCIAVQKNNSAEIKRLLSLYVTEAERHGCQQVLISNEELIAVFSEENHWGEFSRIANQMGFSQIELLLFIRDPVEQALSLYKHRAKNGTVPGIVSWIREGYHLHHHLQGFINVLEKHDLNCSVRKYKKDAQYMKHAFFVDWLGLGLPEKAVPRKVNPSLTLSELKLLRSLHLSNPKITQEMYNRLAEIPRDQKANEPEVESWYRQILADFLCSFEAIWNECNTWLPDGEKLQIPNQVAEDKSLNDEEHILRLKPRQAKTIMKLMADIVSPNMQLKLQARALRKSIGRFKSHLFR